MTCLAGAGAADKTLTDEESGTTFMLDTAASGAAAAITLPAVAAGLNYKFVCKGDAANSTAGTAVSNIVIGVTATQGDTVELFCDGTTWYGVVLSGINNAITTS